MTNLLTLEPLPFLGKVVVILYLTHPWSWVSSQYCVIQGCPHQGSTQWSEDRPFQVPLELLHVGVLYLRGGWTQIADYSLRREVYNVDPQGIADT